MTIELTDEDLGLIQDWYLASAGESAHKPSNELFALIEKLHIPADDSDIWYPDPDDFISEWQHLAIAQIEAIAGYRLRHFESEEVTAARLAQPTPGRGIG